MELIVNFQRALKAVQPHPTDDLGFCMGREIRVVRDHVDLRTLFRIHDQMLPDADTQVWEYIMGAMANNEEYY
jgi:hypothetical protein